MPDGDGVTPIDGAVRVEIAVTHARTRRAIEQLVSAASGLRVVSSGPAIPARDGDRRADVVLLDFVLLGARVDPRTPATIVVGLDDAPGYRAKAIRAGAHDYVSLAEAADALVPVIVARARESRTPARLLRQ